MKKHNFSAGPAILPASVIKEAARAVSNYEGIGLSLLELSHRGPEFTAIIEEANATERNYWPARWLPRIVADGWAPAHSFFKCHSIC